MWYCKSPLLHLWKQYQLFCIVSYNPKVHIITFCNNNDLVLTSWKVCILENHVCFLYDKERWFAHKDLYVPQYTNKRNVSNHRSLYVANKSHKWQQDYHTLLTDIEYFVVEGNSLRVTSIEKVILSRMSVSVELLLCFTLCRNLHSMDQC